MKKFKTNETIDVIQNQFGKIGKNTADTLATIRATSNGESYY